MKRILLTKGKFALVDDKDFDYLNQFNWCFSSKGYASKRGKIINYKYPEGRTILMHRLIMGAVKGQDVDHINFNKLDNRRKNLRLCSRAENLWHKAKTKIKSSSRFKGVHWQKADKVWVTQIMKDGKYKRETFKDELSAAKRYNQLALVLHGKFAYLNKV